LEEWCSKVQGAIGVARCLLTHVDSLEISAEESRCGCETGALDFRVGWGFPFASDPVKEGVDVELVVSDCGIHFVCCGGNLGKVADCQTFTGRPSDEVVRGVFVGVGGLLAACFDDFEDGVYAEAGVGVNFCALAVDDGLGEVVGIYATGEELGGVVVESFILHDCAAVSVSVAVEFDSFVKHDKPSAPGGPSQ